MSIDKNMTFKQFRDSFSSTEEFRKAFGKLSEEEAGLLISNDEGNTTSKAAAMTTWRNCRKEMFNSLDTFDPGWSFEEYCELIQISLMYVMSWPEYHNNPEKTVERVNHEEPFIRKNYENGLTPNDSAADVGFSCG